MKKVEYIRHCIITVVSILFVAQSLDSKLEIGLALFLNGGQSFLNQDYNNFAESLLNEAINDASSNGIPEEALTTTSGEKNATFGFETEMRIKIEKYLMLALNFGFLSLPVKSFKVETSYDPSLFRREHEFDGFSMLLGATEYYILPVGNRVNLNFGIGGAYYRGKIYFKISRTEMGSNYPSPDYAFSGDGLGFFTKLFIDFKITEKINITPGIMSRFARLSSFEGKDEHGKEVTVYSVEWYDQNGAEHYSWELGTSENEIRLRHPVERINKAVIDLSGIILYLGMSFYF